MKALSPKVEAVAAAIADFMLDDGGTWSISYKPQVQWPSSYSKTEQKRAREAAEKAIAAYHGSLPVVGTPSFDTDKGGT